MTQSLGVPSHDGPGVRSDGSPHSQSIVPMRPGYQVKSPGACHASFVRSSYDDQPGAPPFSVGLVVVGSKSSNHPSRKPAASNLLGNFANSRSASIEQSTRCDPGSGMPDAMGGYTAVDGTTAAPPSTSGTTPFNHGTSRTRLGSTSVLPLLPGPSHAAQSAQRIIE